MESFSLGEWRGSRFALIIPRSFLIYYLAYVIGTIYMNDPGPEVFFPSLPLSSILNFHLFIIIENCCLLTIFISSCVNV